MKAIKEQLFHSVFLLYILKCLFGTVICYAFYKALPQYHLSWSVVSLLLVLAPDLDNSMALPIARIKANITGALIGLGCFFLPLPELANLCLGVVATILVCTIFQIPTSTRSALAALVIVFLQDLEIPKWSYATQRILAVLLGCSVALALTLIFQRLPMNQKHPLP